MDTFARILVRPPWIGSPMQSGQNTLSDQPWSSRRRELNFSTESKLQPGGSTNESVGLRSNDIVCRWLICAMQSSRIHSINISSLLINRT
jgi:hypothetical protein